MYNSCEKGSPSNKNIKKILLKCIMGICTLPIDDMKEGKSCVQVIC